MMFVRREITVDATPEKAFEVFTTRFDSWWPRSHHIAEPEMREAVIEPREGGRWYEVGVDGSECEWGEVLAYDPPRRLVLSWHVGADWKYHADQASEIEVSFTPSGAQIVFASALDKESTIDTANWSAEWFNVVATKEYGSPEFSVSEPAKKSRETLAIKSVSLGADGKTVAVEIPGLKPVTNLVIKFKIKSADGALISHEIDSTINRMP